MKSKLFTPSSSAPRECFVNPPTSPGASPGFADAQGGGAMYPLRLNGGGGQKSLMPKAADGVGTTNYPPE